MPTCTVIYGASREKRPIFFTKVVGRQITSCGHIALIRNTTATFYLFNLLPQLLIVWLHAGFPVLFSVFFLFWVKSQYSTDRRTDGRATHVLRLLGQPHYNAAVDLEKALERRRQVQHGGLVAHGGGHRESCRMEKENPCGWPLTRRIHSLKERERQFGSWEFARWVWSLTWMRAPVLESVMWS